ncbi:N-arginine dibasic convertase NRD1, Zn2+-dependent endopeptidase, insulinase superfamily [Pseudoloma neurophilia]|uniref:N-arginine dibasic convertase NRD1, Zn2+-dependent endopeptidase, insulinase superfamily n=1 Tax=Pseudoloma neurophilia TaxID=146866 RepID=A0A0R0M4P3_9MICR|nr:N-arginine dibasic convertase NRD1, Zn2+-dependent endopeptidase, insulinase superfamily [Pseudoloma neurophilia]
MLGEKPPLYRSSYHFFSVGNLKCLYVKNDKITKSYVSMGVDCGSQHDSVPGLAYLLEHLVFIKPEDKNDQNYFRNFLNMHNGDSNAFTSDHMTVYHYEIDTPDLEKSLQLFSHFFRNPMIEEKTIEREMNNVDSRFQMRKKKDYCRIWRLQEILSGKKFSTGNKNTFGTDYKKLQTILRNFHAKYYNKMVFVIQSNLELIKIKRLTEKFFTLPLDVLTQSERKCLYCEDKSRQKNLLQVDKFSQIRSNNQKKSIYIFIPLISEYKLPYNIYEPIKYFLDKNDHTSLQAALKRENLVISMVCNIKQRGDQNILFLEMAVNDTNKYYEILEMVRDYIKRFYKNFLSICEDSRRVTKLEWEKSEDPNPRSHVIDFIKKLLRSNILFTDMINEHECQNIALEKCFLVLVDKEFEIESKRDEYELQYEEHAFKELSGNIDRDFWKIQFNKYKTEKFDDKINNLTVYMLTYKDSKFVQIFDNFKTNEATVKLNFKLDATLEDQLDLNIFIQNINNVYSDFFESNGIKLTSNFSKTAISFRISGTNPMIGLALIICQAQIDLIDPITITYDLLQGKIKKKLDRGFKRVSNELDGLYFSHSKDLESEISDLEKIIRTRSVISKVSFFKKASKLEMIIGGIEDTQIYFDSFKRIVEQLSGDSRVKSDLTIREQFKTNLPIFNYDENGFLSQKSITALKTIKAKNKASSLFFRIGSGIRNMAITSVVYFILQEKLFNKHRTDDKLGHALFVSYKILRDEVFVSFNVQSEKEVLSEIIKFIHTQDFTIKNVQSIINEIMVQQFDRKSLLEFYAYLMSLDLCLKNWHNDICEEIRKVTPEDLKEALKKAEMVLVQSEEFK